MNINNQTERIGYLIARELIHGLTADESAELDSWKGSHPDQVQKIALLMEKDHLRRSLNELDEVEEQLIRDFRKAGMPVQPLQRSTNVFPFRKLGYAAAILLLITSIGLYWYQPATESRQAGVIHQKPLAAPIVPGREGAILTLADGSTMLLDSLANGQVATQGNTRITLQNGSLAYSELNGGKTDTAYNIMTTPKGRQFHLILPDGTRAWLNASSSLRYPVSFGAHERRVEVSGEVYFEVTSNKAAPFKVSINHETTVEVLGTRFNIKAYNDEKKIYTTLLEGAVRVACNTQRSLLTPGCQAELNATPLMNEPIQINKHIDEAKVMAWKNGLFNFQDVRLEELMRQIARWYDIEVVYESTIPSIEFWGKMGMDLPLKDVLTFLGKSDVHFRIEGRKLVVLK